MTDEELMRYFDDLYAGRIKQRKPLDPYLPDYEEDFVFCNKTSLRYSVRRSDLGINAHGEVELLPEERYGLWLLSLIEQIKSDEDLCQYIGDRMLNQDGESYKLSFNIHLPSAIGWLMAICHEGGISDLLRQYGFECNQEWLDNARSLSEIGQPIEPLLGMIQNTTDLPLDLYDIPKLSRAILFNSTISWKEDDKYPVEFIYGKSVFLSRIAITDVSWAKHSEWTGPSWDYFGFYLQYGTTYFQTYPFFYLYDLLSRGGICHYLFDYLNDSDIKVSDKARLLQITSKLGEGENMEFLKQFDAQYQPYRKLGGADISFLPWRYSEIANDFRQYYRECTRHSKGAKLPYGFIESCLPVVVEEILPSIKNATEAVGLIVLIRNAKGFDPEWKEKESDEDFKYRMVDILRLHEFDSKYQSLRYKNKRVRESAAILYDRYPILRRFTYIEEGS